MYQPDPHDINYSDLLTDISRGQIKIPQFQRDFVWTKERSARLLDSVIKGYPIGTFILWKTKDRLRSIRDIGEDHLPDPQEGDFVNYILDGQQRITSLYAALKGLKIARKDREDDFSGLYLNLSAEPNVDNQIITAGPPEGALNVDFLKVTDLLNADFTFLGSFPKEYHEKLSTYKKRFETYAFSLITVREAPIDVATEIFTRINIGAKPLSVFEIMVAKTFDDRMAFDLSEKYDELMEELQSVDYDTVSPAVVLQTISAILVGTCDKSSILRLEKSEFIRVWDDTVNSIRESIDHLRDCYSAKVSRMLPYAHLLVPFAYFYYKHPSRPSGIKLKRLEDFFWRTSLGGRYSYSVESKIAQDLKRIDEIIENRDPDYDYGIDVSAEFIARNGWFSATRSFVKSILCLLASQEPKSFSDRSSVRISNDWLQRANSKNYHHFFPKAYLKNQGEDESKANHIANITIVDDRLNKQRIRARAPSSYLEEFMNENEDLEKTLRTHLIEIEDDAVMNNDYSTFFDNRCHRLSEELRKKILPREIDLSGQHVHTDDFEEDPESGS